jgi:hypothetical protein
VGSVDSEDFLASYLCSKENDKFIKVDDATRAYFCDSRRAKRYIIAAVESLEMIPS